MMFGSVPFTVITCALATYGVWFVRRDFRRGTASGRGFRFSKKAQPKRYRALMSFNILAVGLLCTGVIIQFVEMVRPA
jgi:hypothetical protein